MSPLLFFGLPYSLDKDDNFISVVVEQVTKIVESAGGLLVMTATLIRSPGANEVRKLNKNFILFPMFRIIKPTPMSRQKSDVQFCLSEIPFST